MELDFSEEKITFSKSLIDRFRSELSASFSRKLSVSHFVFKRIIASIFDFIGHFTESIKIAKY